MVAPVPDDFAAISVRLTPLFEARWSYEAFTRVMPFGPDSEGQGFAFSNQGRVDGERLSGSYRTIQYPRWRADGVYLPDAHGIVDTDVGAKVITHAAGYVIPWANGKDRWTITHWMRFWTGAADLAWLNATVAVGIGSMDGGHARVSYFAAAPTTGPTDVLEGAPQLNVLGTARWEYPVYEAVRLFGDKEGVGIASSTGEVRGGLLEGKWRGWHYPTYLRDGLYLLDAHVEIEGPNGVVLNRHAGLATRPAQASGDVIYDLAQHATFVTEAPTLATLNRTLALGVGYVHDPGLVHLSYYAVTGQAASG
ncbi:MAG: DUF3237 domain-containing protein [Candidatus Dormibacteraeota bacterium]|nr:DUF3237 domain-containing protein [Candidatus Dormibacteraeota bacterium]